MGADLKPLCCIVFIAAILAADTTTTTVFATDKVETETIILPTPDSSPTDKPLGILEDAEPLQSGSEVELKSGNPALPDILRDVEALPSPVRRMRSRLIEAARSGDPEQLRPIMELLEEPPIVSHVDGLDPIEALKAASGDGEGLETLAIMLEVLEAGFVHVDVGTESEHFLWPYFSRARLDDLTPKQKVELFEIVTAYDLEEMREFGVYNFFRLGIAPDGQWLFFISGD